jgi:DNA-binding protein YbaB
MMKNLGNMLKEAQKLQSKMAEMQARLAETEISGSAGRPARAWST